MARIRTIKPEFPQSESMGRVSRDARLLFIMLWTIADDEGRLRGNSRMLASLLFPYDDDARDLSAGWLDELQREGCLIVYRVGSDTYIQIRNWLIHQKIDKPSRSKIPAFVEPSRILANPREGSSGDQGSRIKDQGEDQGSVERAPTDVAAAIANLFLFAICPQTKTAEPPPPIDLKTARASKRCPADFAVTDELRQWAASECPAVNLTNETKKFMDHTFATARADWPATWRNWIRKAGETARASRHDLAGMDYNAGVTANGKF